MSGYAEAQPAGHPGGGGSEYENWRWSGHRFGPPLPVKILAVVAAFWLFHPLGVALALYFLWRAARRNGGCSFHRAGVGGPWERRAWRGLSFRNSAFEERRRETLKQLDEEAEAFEAFERKQSEAHDREAFDRFMAERRAGKSADEPK
jgi:hypothetical protein